MRICYRFTTLINIDEMQLPFGWDISVGEVYLQKDRVFTVGWYPPRPTPSPPPAPTPPPPTTAPTPSPSPTPSASPTGTPGPTGPPTPTPVATPSPTPCPPPVASFTATPTSGKKPLTVNFLNTSTSGCAILSYLWNFGDGVTSPGQNPTHIFTVQGNQTSRLYGHIHRDEPERNERAGHRPDHGDEVKWPRRRAGTRGQSLVEFALIAPLLFLMISGIITLGIGVFYQQQLQCRP